MSPSLRLGSMLALALLVSVPEVPAAEPGQPKLSARQTKGLAELMRCQRATYLNRVARERLAPFLSGREALRNLEDMTRMQDYNRKLDAWFSELVEYFGQAQVMPLLPPDREADRTYLQDDSGNEADSRAMVSATAREANVCLADEQDLREMLSAP